MQNEVQGNEDDLKDLDKKVSWPVLFSDNEVYRKYGKREFRWQKTCLK